MKRFTSLLVCLLLFGLQAMMAQDIQISGTVTDVSGAPLPGVSIVVKGTTTGTASNVDGNYELPVPPGAVLVFSSVGMVSQEITVGSQTVIDVVLEADILGLDEVVVTALGITRERKALGYSVQDVSGDDLVQARDPNILNSLQGKVSGVQISAGQGAVGAGSRILIRGMGSLSGDNQPLFVVDGVPILNNLSSVGTYGGRDYGNAAADINPNDIETITVLKGANAAAIYGSRAAYGVVMITTKKGRKAKGVGVTLEQNMMWDTPLVLPDLQNDYGQGYSGEFEYFDGNGGGINDNVDESWGPPLDGRLIPQFDSPYANPDDPNDFTRQPTPWVAHPDNIKNLLQTGLTSTTNLALTGSGERANVRVSLARQVQKGIYPNTDQKKNSLSVSTSASLTKRLKVDASAMYINLNNDNIPGTGYSSLNPLYTYAMWGGRQVSTESLREIWNQPDPQHPGRFRNWNHSYHDNPFFTLNKNLNSRNRNRIIGTVALQYYFTDWLNVKARVGTDYYAQARKEQRAKGSNDWPEGRFTAWSEIRNETNADVVLNFNREFGDISIDANAGANIKRYFARTQTTDVDEIIVPDLYTVSNAQVPATTNLTLAEDEIQSVFGFATLGFRDWLYLDVTARNDWSSTLPKENNSYFYPSFSLSWLVTDMIGLPRDVLSYGKVRASWAQVGAPAGRYRLATTYAAADPFDGNPRLTLGNRIPALDLKPETTTSLEFGADVRFFMNRLGIDFTWYKQNTTDQILDIEVSRTTGFANKTINAGEVQNSGIEILLTGSPVRTSDFSWDIDVNFTRNKNEVISLAPDMKFLNLYYSSWGTYVQARPGQLYGNIYGRSLVRETRTEDPETGLVEYSGRLLINPANGSDIRTPESIILGNIVPDWMGSIRNSFFYRNVNFSFLIDTRQGSDLFSITHWFGHYAGMLEETVGYNDKGNLKRDPVEDGGGVLIPGVYGEIGDDGNPVYLDADGNPSSTPVTNTTYREAQSWGHGFYGEPGRSVFDASFVKLREVILGYTFDQQFIRNLGIQSINLSLVGRNLAILKKNIPHIDPELGFSAGRIQGMESTQLPSLRSMGFNLRVTF